MMPEEVGANEMGWVDGGWGSFENMVSPCQSHDYTFITQHRW
jgi:hypothetical protein